MKEETAMRQGFYICEDSNFCVFLLEATVCNVCKQRKLQNNNASFVKY